MILVIDNYDSFTYNLVRYFEELGEQVLVIKNDECSVEEISALAITHIVVSPGPCTPNESGVSLQVVRRLAGKIPILGVCLGHQAIAQVFGADVTRAKCILHGKTSRIEVSTEDSVLFKDCAKQFNVTRYHSLIVNDTKLDDSFVVSAYSTNGNVKEVMAIESKQYRVYGVQYHPESLLTEFGHQVLKNFLIEG